MSLTLRGLKALKPYACRTYTRNLATAAENDKFKILVVGAGSAGLSAAQQIYDRFAAGGTPLAAGDVAIVDGADSHYYQPGWTLVGSGLRPKSDFRAPLASLVPNHIAYIPENVKSFAPNSSSVTTVTGRQISYDALVVATGLQINWDAIKGLSKALGDPNSGVSSIYSYDTCDKTWSDIESLRSGQAIFTQPAGIIKCAGAPQKIMWMAWDRYRRTKRGDNIKVDFYTGMPTMFSVKKYSDALDRLRLERGVGGHFQHNLVAVDTPNHKATFKKADGSLVDVDYTLLHVTPPMGPLDMFKGSPIADSSGWVDVDKSTMRHNNPQYGNIFALGDCSSLPTSKTAAAITAQTPVLTENLYSVMQTGKLLTGYGELMLAEFKYGLEPKETFSSFFDQAKSHRLFYHFKKAPYWNLMVIAQGEYLEPTFDPASLTVSQLLGVLGYHNVKYPTPYSKTKLVMIFKDEIKANASRLRNERVKKANSIASDDGILDGVTGEPLRKAGEPLKKQYQSCLNLSIQDPVKRRASRRLSSHAPIEDQAETAIDPPPQPKRRRSSAQPTLGGPSRKSAITQPTLVEESEPEDDMPIRKVGRNRKTAAEDSGWEDTNIFQSGAESSSPLRPSPIRPKATRKNAPGPHRSRKSSSAPPQMLLSSPPPLPNSPHDRRFSPLPLSPPQFKFEPHLPSVPPAEQLHLNQLQPSSYAPSALHIVDDQRDELDLLSSNVPEDDGSELPEIKQEMDQEEGVVDERGDSPFSELLVAEDESVEAMSMAQDTPGQPSSLARYFCFSIVILLFIPTLLALLSYQKDSSSLGYCYKGSLTNDILEERRMQRLTLEACHNGTLVSTDEDMGTSCPLPPLQPWGSPDACTQCPDHAECTVTSVVCDHGYLLQPHPWFLFAPAPPSSRSIDFSFSLPPADLFWKWVSLLDGLPGFGSVAFPPRCVENLTRRRKIFDLGKVIELRLSQERGSRLCAGGKRIQEAVADTDGGEAKKWGVQIETLSDTLRKASPVQNFDDMFNTAIQRLVEWDRVIIGEDHDHSETPRIMGAMEFCYHSVFSWRSRSAQRRIESKRVADLVHIALDTLRNQELAHHTDPVTNPQSYLSSIQLRDLILQDEHSVTSRSRLWDQVERVVEGNANVRANLQEIYGGDEMRVWQWVGSARGKATKDEDEDEKQLL
ncbi:hypothetical protein H0H93_014510 [Arthromyces matolae]|nr:hypothetical protein H0H93_014510 [Arthromyces matolae]